MNGFALPCTNAGPRITYGVPYYPFRSAASNQVEVDGSGTINDKGLSPDCAIKCPKTIIDGKICGYRTANGVGKRSSVAHQGEASQDQPPRLIFESHLHTLQVFCGSAFFASLRSD